MSSLNVYKKTAAFFLTFCCVVLLLCGCSRNASLQNKGEETFQIAFAYPLDGAANSVLERFQTEHADLNFELVDYSEYNTPLDPTGGENKLCIDLVNGLCKPDLIIGEPESELMIQVTGNHLFHDLSPYLAEGAKVRFGDLFASVRTSYSTSAVEIWGICTAFTAETIIGNNALIGNLCGKTEWTIDDLLDLADSLPADVYLMAGVTQETASGLLLGKDMAEQFINREDMTCSFDDGRFTRWLRFLSSLPRNYDQLLVSSPLDAATSAERYEYFHQNKVALYGEEFWNMRFFTNMKAAFGTDDYTFLGYPSGQQNPVRLDLEQTYVIASSAEDPKLVWELIEAFFITDPDALYRIHSIPVLKSMFEAIADDYAQYDFITYFSGSGGQVLHDDMIPFTEEDLEQPGIITRFTEQDRQRILNLFDNVNQPLLTERTPEA